MGSRPFEITEDKAAAVHGISRDRIRQIREEHLSAGVHFTKTSRGIVILDLGMEKIAEICAVRIEQLLNETATTGQAESQVVINKPVYEALRVWILCNHPGWVRARRESGEMVYCRVRWNRDMRRGMVLKSCHIGDDGKWTSIGGK